MPTFLGSKLPGLTTSPPTMPRLCRINKLRSTRRWDEGRKRGSGLVKFGLEVVELGLSLVLFNYFDEEIDSYW